MNSLILIPLFLLSILFAGCSKDETAGTDASATTAGHEDPEGYYTCSMHPEVHEHGPGRCPICGMALTKVPGKKDSSKRESLGLGIQVSDLQMTLAGIGRHIVGRKDLHFSLPVSGRMSSSREVSLQVYESDVQLIQPGQSFSGSTVSRPDKILQGKIRQVDTLVDPSSRTVRVLGVLDPQAERMLIDGGFHGEIKTVRKNQLAVPVEAVLHAGTRDLVYLIADHQISPRAIVIGKKAKGFYQVVSGISEGDVVSSGPNFLIDSEARIRGGND